MKIYFAGAIHGGRGDQDLYVKIVELLQNYGEVLTEHISDINLTASGKEMDDKTISGRDLAWLKDADRLVAEVTAPSLGVGFEIGKATEWQKPGSLSLPSGRQPQTLGLDRSSNSIDVCEYQTVSELKKIFDGFFGIE